MDTTKPMACPCCSNQEMDGFGGNFGGRITMWKKKCHACGFVVMLIPMEKGYSYKLSAQTEDEEREAMAKRKRLRDLEKEAEDLRRELAI